MPRRNASQNLVSKERLSVVEYGWRLHWTLKLDREQLDDGVPQADQIVPTEEQLADRELSH